VESTAKGVEPAAERHGCLREDDAIALLSRGSLDLDASAMLSHMEVCSSCRRLVGAAARDRVTTGGRALCTLAAGDRLGGRYQILRLLARGGMGEVYETRDELLGEVVALKTIVLSALDNQHALSALKAEVQLARKVSHRNVCRILEFGIHSDAPGDTVPFFTMELLQGETLRERIKRARTLPVAEALPIVRQIIEGLAAIHAAGIVHRDLKPENVVLLTERQGLRAVVMDFGLARPLDLSQSLVSSTWPEEESGHRPAGTLEYMSPEQLRGVPATIAFDVYALGTIMFEMLSGARPFARGRSGSWAATLERLDCPAPALSSVLSGADPTWEHAIARCLATDPGERFAAIEDVREALLAPRRGERRRKRPLILTAVAMASLSALAVALWSRAPEAPAAPPVVQASPAPARPVASAGNGMLDPFTVSAPRRSVAAPPPRARRSASRPLHVTAPPLAASAPEDAAALVERAEGLLVAGEGAAACALGEQAALNAPAAPVVHRFLGKCYMRLSNPQKARRHYGRYLELAPDAPDGVFVRAIVQSGR
jgi:serine/threonine-protein kinase